MITLLKHQWHIHKGENMLHHNTNLKYLKEWNRKKFILHLKEIKLKTNNRNFSKQMETE